MCVRTLALCFFVPPPHSHPDSLFYLSFSVSGHNRILLCFSGMCQNPVMLFRDSVPSESVVERESLCMSARLCAWLRLSVPLMVRSALLSGPRSSQMVTRGGLQLTSNHTRVTYWRGSGASLRVPKLRPCGVMKDVSLNCVSVYSQENVRCGWSRHTHRSLLSTYTAYPSQCHARNGLRESPVSDWFTSSLRPLSCMIPWDVLMRGPCVTLSLGTSVPV